MTTPLPYSRPQGVADSLGDIAIDRHRFLDKRVLVTGERSALHTANGRNCLLSSVRLLVRICRNVTVLIPTGCDDAYDQVKRMIPTLPGIIPLLVKDRMALKTFDAILNVGSLGRADVPWTVINSSGWMARVSSVGTHPRADLPSPTPIGALAAASLGVSEVFKRLLGLREIRGKLFDGLNWSLWSYAANSDQGPELPDSMLVELVLVGAGAIGNGIVSLLNGLPLRGAVAVVDPQCYGDENLGTCILLERDQIGLPKASVAERCLSGRLKATGHCEDLAAYRERLGTGVAYPKVVVSALDNIAARYDVQDLWPDLVIDSAIGDFACQVSRHGAHDDTACLRCVFREPPGEAADLLSSRLTGLDRSRIADAESVVTMEDVRKAPKSKQTNLRNHVGRTVCSVVGEAVAANIAKSPRLSFQPSVPFVACLSAAMAAAELVKATAGWPTALDTRFQFDVLRGPQFGQMIPQSRREDCVCVTRSRNIELWRKSRNSLAT